MHRRLFEKHEKGTIKVFQAMIDSDQIGTEGVSTGTETILLVDDEEPVQYLVREILERRGYRVLTAPDGPSASTVSSNFQGDIHLLLTDVMMRGMSGLEVAQCLAAARPLMKVLFMSGYPETVVFEPARMWRDRYFLRKPFLALTLTRKIREVLDSLS